jgi:hypothetical protein
MIFAVLDYLRYRRRTGKYGRTGALRFAFIGHPTHRLWPILQEGDVLFVATYGHFLSWLIMYVTDSPFSHAAVYIGNEQIAHMTTGGFAVEGVDALCDSNTAIVPVMLPETAVNRRQKLKDVLRKYRNEPYGWIPAVLKGVRILLARDLPAYRLKFAADLFLLTSVLDALLVIVRRSAIFYWFFLAYLCIVVVAALLFLRNPGKYDRLTPMSFFNALRSHGYKSVLYLDELGKTTPIFVSTDMYVFLPEREALSGEPLRDEFDAMGIAIKSLKADSRPHGEFKIKMETERGRAEFTASYGDFEPEAKRLRVPPELGLSQCLVVSSSLRPRDVCAALLYSCIFAHVHKGYYCNVGLKGGFSPEQALAVARDYIQQCAPSDLA